MVVSVSSVSSSLESSISIPQRRESYSRLKTILEIPNLNKIQLDSFYTFAGEKYRKDPGYLNEPSLRREKPEEKESGLTELFNEISPIADFTGNRMELSFGEYYFGLPKFVKDDVVKKLKAELKQKGLDRQPYLEDLSPAELKVIEMECRQRDATFSGPLWVEAQLLIKETGEIKKQHIFLGDFPWMTSHGTFVINGAERVVVSQLVRSPGVYFALPKDISSDRSLCMTKLIPNRGAWLEFETTSKDMIFVKVDGKRKIPITTLLRAIGYGSDEELLGMFEKEDNLPEKDEDKPKHFYIKCSMERDGEIIEKAGESVKKTREIIEKVKGSFEKAKELLKKSAEESDIKKEIKIFVEALLKKAKEEEDPKLEKINYMKIASEASALIDIYKKLRPTDPPNLENAHSLINNLFFNSRRYDLGRAGQYKLNKRWNLDPEKPHRVLTREDLVEITRHIIMVNKGLEPPDDIDHLGNRRVRTIGELVQNSLRIGLLRMERVVKERMSINDPATATPSVLINIRPIVGALREFFGASQLSQFMDQTNPLAGLTHKRRLSALGPGGLSRERAGFDVRDVHHSHYGRICPIETPEGPNIGLIGSLATYGIINEFGFIETPLRKVKWEINSHDEGLIGRIVRENINLRKGKLLLKAGEKMTEKEASKLASGRPFPIKVAPYVSGEIEYLTADEEEEKVIAQANKLDEMEQFINTKIEVRRGRKYFLESPEMETPDGGKEKCKIDYVDVSPKQIVGLTTSLIPFLEHNDANRALMGANMQRQAVPLIRPETPLVATGMERIAARDSGQVIFCQGEGEVISASSTQIIVKEVNRDEKVYPLMKFLRTNQGTCINQRPVVSKGDDVVPGQVLADSYATSEGELSLGQNVLCAFMSWEGYNFEDAILISERMVKEDRFTSIHIEKYEIEARDTKLGPEEITRDIPNVSEESLRNLDENGIICIGAEVGPGDILVGKITPKGETELTAEDRLLRAIFGEKAKDVKDASLRVPHGESGRIIDVKVFSRKNNDDLPAAGVNKLVKVWVAIKRRISVGDKMAGRHGNKGVIARILPQEDMPFLPDGRPVDIVLNPIGVPSRMNIGQVFETHLGWASEVLGMRFLSPVFDGAKIDDIEEALARSWIIHKAQAVNTWSVDGKPYDLEKVKAWLKEKGYDGDKVFPQNLSGEAKRVCLELWLKDLGETASPSDAELASLIDRIYRERKLIPPTFGKSLLRDGRTGEPFDQPVTVGNIYIMKLIHLVEDKIHARSTGPYSLITQQPLGGKAQFGGQRFGEMEVWALEAYGATHILQELLTVKSDDINGRAKTYEAVIKGENVLQPGVPESFKVLTKELQSLGLSVEVLNEDEEKISLKDEALEGPRLQETSAQASVQK